MESVFRADPCETQHDAGACEDCFGPNGFCGFQELLQVFFGHLNCDRGGSLSHSHLSCLTGDIEGKESIASIRFQEYDGSNGTNGWDSLRVLREQRGLTLRDCPQGQLRRTGILPLGGSLEDGAWVTVREKEESVFRGGSRETPKNVGFTGSLRDDDSHRLQQQPQYWSAAATAGSQLHIVYGKSSQYSDWTEFEAVLDMQQCHGLDRQWHRHCRGERQ